MNRFGCFVAILSLLGSAAAAAPSPWVVNYAQSKMDDSQSVYATVRSAEQIGDKGPAVLTLRCQERVTAAIFEFAGSFLADVGGYGDVDLRVDAKKAMKLRLSESTDNKALGLWTGAEAIPFIKSLINGRLLFVRATPFNGSPIEVTFPIAGIEDALFPLRKACGWPK
jgi:type VI secretion system protein VasI